MMQFLTAKSSASIATLRCLVLGILVFTSSLAAQTPPNVLFIMADDLRPELGCYGVKHVVTPNLDRLAAAGVRFERAYCQEAICMSSRTSMLSGCRPDRHGIWTNRDVRSQLTGLPFLPEHFKNTATTPSVSARSRTAVGKCRPAGRSRIFFPPTHPTSAAPAPDGRW